MVNFDFSTSYYYIHPIRSKKSSRASFFELTLAFIFVLTIALSRKIWILLTHPPAKVPSELLHLFFSNCTKEFTLYSTSVPKFTFSLTRARFFYLWSPTFQPCCRRLTIRMRRREMFAWCNDCLLCSTTMGSRHVRGVRTECTGQHGRRGAIKGLEGRISTHSSSVRVQTRLKIKVDQDVRILWGQGFWIEVQGRIVQGKLTFINCCHVCIYHF